MSLLAHYCQNISVSFISHRFLRRKHPTEMPAPAPVTAPAVPPPPPPPKEPAVRSTQDIAKPLPIPFLDHLADVSVASTTDHYPPSPPASPPLPPPPPPSSLKGRVDLSPRLRLSPEERLQRRLATQRLRECEEQDALREERERQARRQREKAEAEQRAREDDERRRVALQEQLQRAAARRAREERDAKATEEQQLHELKERKRLEHERRLQHTRRMQKWRREYIRRVESQSSEKEEERKREVEQRRSRIASMSDVLLQDDQDAFSGWVTIQTPDQFTWKRRFFMVDLAHAQLSLCRNQRDSTRTVELIDLDGQIESFNEWYDGFDELEAIPHSFAVKFVDGHAWLMYADTEHDKDRLLLLLSEAAGIIL